MTISSLVLCFLVNRTIQLLVQMYSKGQCFIRIKFSTCVISHMFYKLKYQPPFHFISIHIITKLYYHACSLICLLVIFFIWKKIVIVAPKIISSKFQHIVSWVAISCLYSTYFSKVIFHVKMPRQFTKK